MFLNKQTATERLSERLSQSQSQSQSLAVTKAFGGTNTGKSEKSVAVRHTQGSAMSERYLDAFPNTAPSPSYAPTFTVQGRIRMISKNVIFTVAGASNFTGKTGLEVDDALATTLISPFGISYDNSRSCFYFADAMQNKVFTSSVLAQY